MTNYSEINETSTSVKNMIERNYVDLVVEVLAKNGSVLTVKGIDMLDGTPILDIKPHVSGKVS